MGVLCGFVECDLRTLEYWIVRKNCMLQGPYMELPKLLPGSIKNLLDVKEE